MKDEGSFVIDGKKRNFGMWFVTLLGTILVSVLYVMDEVAGGEVLLVCVIHVFSIKSMTSRITLNDQGAHYKSLFESKRYSWDEIKDYGIVLKRSGITTNRWGAEYNVYFSDSENASKKASQSLLFVGIRLCITESDFERIECELRTFGREYAKLEPYISEYWE